MSAKSFCCITLWGGGGGGGLRIPENLSEYYIPVMSDGGTSSWGGGLSCLLSSLLSKYTNSSICFKDTVSAKSFCCVPPFFLFL